MTKFLQPQGRESSSLALNNTSAVLKNMWFYFGPLPSFFPSSFLPEVLCDSIDLILRQVTLFEAKTGHTTFINGLLAMVFRRLIQL